jgi:hypothetical protein
MRGGRCGRIAGGAPVSDFERRSFKKPGYNCGPGGKDCQHDKKGNHGIHCEEWWYIVRQENFAISLSVFSGDYPDGLHNHKPRAVALSTHQRSAEGGPCDIFDDRCIGDCTYLGAELFFDQVGCPRFEQNEIFWKALEAYLVKERCKLSS